MIPEYKVISLTEYYKGRQIEYKSELTEEIKTNAVRLLLKVNHLLFDISDKLKFREVKDTIVTSGWRPASINKQIGGAKASAHLMGQAVDLSDPEGKLGLLLLENTDLLKKHGLFLEHPHYTKGWIHLQSRETRNRVFIP